MGTVKRVKLSELAATVKRDMTELRDRLDHAVEETVRDSQGIVWERVPFAFGELHNSIHPEPEAHPTRLVADAPHAAPVEVGSAPHMPPVEPLERWAELRGLDDPKSAAWAIAKKIEADGTKPTFYMRGSLPRIREVLDRRIKAALGK